MRVAKIPSAKRQMSCGISLVRSPRSRSRRAAIDVLLLIAASAVLVSPMKAASWYVRPTSVCANNGNGSASNCATSPGGAGAWRDFSGISWSQITAGSTLYLIGGDTWNEQMQIGSSGTSANRITISVYGSGKVTLSGAGGFDFKGNSYVTIDGLRGNAIAGDTNYGITVTNIPSDSYCVYEYNGGHDLRIYHIECTGTATSGSNDYSGGMYFGINGNGMDIAYNWVHGPTPVSGSAVSCDTFTNNQQMWCATGIKMFTNGGTSTFSANQIYDNKIEKLFNDGLDCSNDCSMYNNDVSVIQLSGHSDSIQVPRRK